MANPRKVLLKAHNNPKGLRFAEFTALVEAFGFAFQRQSGRHRMYFRPGVPELVNVQPLPDGKAKDYQVVRFLALVERYGLDMGDQS